MRWNGGTAGRADAVRPGRRKGPRPGAPGDSRSSARLSLPTRRAPAAEEGGAWKDDAPGPRPNRAVRPGTGNCARASRARLQVPAVNAVQDRGPAPPDGARGCVVSVSVGPGQNCMQRTRVSCPAHRCAAATTDGVRCANPRRGEQFCSAHECLMPDCDNRASTAKRCSEHQRPKAAYRVPSPGIGASPSGQ